MNPLPGFAGALLPAQASTPASLKAWNGSDPSPRFAVHRNNVITSLVGALEDGFPVTCRLVGETFFRAMAREYVRAQPPRSPVVVEHGAGFAGFVERFAPAASVPFLADVARLERARIEAFHAADADSLAAEAFAGWLAAPEELMRCRVALHPSLRLVRAAHPVLALWRAHEPGRGDELVEALSAAAVAQPQDILVLRPVLDVHARVLGAGQATLLEGLSSGLPLGEALSHAAAEPGFELAAALDVIVHGGATLRLERGDAAPPLL